MLHSVDVGTLPTLKQDPSLLAAAMRTATTASRHPCRSRRNWLGGAGSRGRVVGSGISDLVCGGAERPAAEPPGQR
jgi:hypothetical protein